MNAFRANRAASVSERAYQPLAHARGSQRRRILHSALLLLAVAGCEAPYGFKGDPLTGNMPANPAPLQFAGGTAGGGKATPGAMAGVPPLPASHEAGNQAVLASGIKAPPEAASDLHIAGDSAGPANGGAARGASPTGVVLDGPQPVPQSTSRLTPIAPMSGSRLQPIAASGAAPPSTAASAGDALTFEQAQAKLKQWGVTWQRLETWGDKGQWRFRCSRPIPNSSNLNKTYETASPLPSDPLTAIRAVIDKIEQENR